MKPQWSEVQAWAQQRLETARQRNDGNLDALETAKLRGRIEAYKELLAFERQSARPAPPGAASVD